MSIRKSSHRLALAIVAIAAITATASANWSTDWNFLEFLGLSAPAETIQAEPTAQAPTLADTRTVCNTGTPDFATIALAVADANAAVPAGGRTYLVCAGHTETAPAGGYSITAASNAADPISFVKDGIGANPTITANGALTVGALNDAIFKIIGSDYVTIDGFTMLENGANTNATAGTNTMTEWGVALLYASTTNGAQNCTIQNNTITLNRTYPNTFGIYSNSTHSATSIATSATATTAAGGNENLKIYGNAISNVNMGIVHVGPTAAADQNITADIGGTTALTGNSITDFGTTTTGLSGYANVSGTINGILVRNTKSFNISRNTVNSSNGGVVVGTLNGIQVPAASNAPTGTLTQTINNNSISLRPGATGIAMNGINMPSTSVNATTTSSINNNDFNNFGHTVASATGAITFISQGGNPLVQNLNGNTFTNISVNTSGTITFFSFAPSLISTASMSLSNNSIVTGFTRTGVGTTTIYSSNASSVAGSTKNISNNAFSNFTLTGASAFNGIVDTDGGAPVKTVIGNTISNITTGAGTVVPMNINFSGAGTTVNNNIITGITTSNSITAMLIGSSNAATITVSGNTIDPISSAGTALTGISSAAPTAVISKNKIYSLNGTGTSTQVNGIDITNTTSSSTVTVSNNIVGNLTSDAATADDRVRGLSLSGVATTSNYNVYYNTIYLNTSAGGSGFGSSGVFHTANATATTSTLNLRNNIIVNNSFHGTGATVAFRRSSSAINTLANYASTSNNNLFYAGTPGTANLIYTDGGNTLQTLSAYKGFSGTPGTIAPRDSASISENPPFLSTTGSSVDFLHINTATPTQIESGGSPVAGITDDFDGNVRNVSTPDIGADEFAGTGLDLSPPIVTYTALGNTASLGNRTLTTSITDATGVPTAGIGLPVLYWRINAGAYIPATATYVSGSQYDFTFGAGVVATDVVSYYIVAQDTAGTPNVGSTPAGGSGFTINPPAAATPPGSPSTYTIVPSISGTKTVGAGGDYTTLTAAIAAINGSEVTGPVVLSLTDASYTTPAETFPLVLNANGGSSATNTITIVPAASNVTSITGAAASGCLIRLNGADYVTIDGSNSGGTDRSLTLTNTSTTSPATVCISSLGTGAGATNNTVKNTNISTGSNTTTSYGITVGGATPGTTGADNDSTVLDNNAITRAANGIVIAGTAAVSTGGDDGLSITGNLVGPASAGADNISVNGIFVQNAVAPTISGNTARNVVSTTVTVAGIALSSGVPNAVVSQNSVSGITTSPSSTTSYGMFIGTGSTGAAISRNIITNISQTSASGYPARGLYVSTGSASAGLSISNNSISDIRSYSDPSTAFSFQPVGMFIAGSQGGISLYYNSVNLFGSNPGLTSATLQAAVYIGTSVTGLDLRNNVFRNSYDNSSSGTDKSYSIYSDSANTAYTIINYNDYFVSGTPGVLGFLGSDRVDLAGMQAGFGQNIASINASPLFNTDTNLQPGSGSPLLLAGTPIGGITTDILGVTRDVTTPTIGAYETIADVGGPTITYTPLPNTSSLLDTNITATITDPSGVPTSGSLRPRVYFKRSIDASYVSRVCTFSAGTYNCGLLYAALPGAPVAGDTIQYFVIAQDNIGNVSSSPSGVVATNVNTVTTPPTPNSYNILLEITSYPYSQNFESGAGGYTSAIVGGAVNDWILGTPAKTQLSAAHSGSNAWVTKLTGSYSSSHNAAVVSPIFNFTSVASTATISFWQNFDISGDPDWDSMVLEASTDGGTVWNRVDSTLGTGPTFDTANSTGWYNLSGVNGPITGPEWTNTSTAYTGHAAGWIQSTTKVGALAGQASVLLRWRFASDSSFVDEGFAIDDIAVTPLVVAPGNLQLSSATYSGNENTTLNVDVNRVSGSAGTVGVTATLADVSATGGAACGVGVDYINPGPQNLTFVDSDVLETISVTLCSDAVADASETFTVTLSAPTGGAGLGTPTAATATINDVPPPLSGTYTVGSGGNYPSLTNAGGIFEALNLSGMSGQVFIDVISDLTGETGTHQLNDITAGNNLTIRPNGGLRSITGSSAAGLIVINGADNVVIDGSGTDANAGPTVGGDSSLRNLTITNTNTGTGSAVVAFSTGTNGATNNTIKNVNIIGSSSTTGTLVGIAIGGNTIGTAGADNDNNRITNCTVQKTFYGIVSIGASAANPNSQNQINRNDLSATGANSIGKIAIYIANEDTVQVHENSVGGISNILATDAIGLGIGAQNVLTSSATSGNITNGTIYRNRINGIANANTYSAIGIAAACTSCALANNMITGVVSDATSGDFTAGIFVVSGTGTSTNVFHNSVAMTGDRGATAEYPSYAMAINGTDTPVALVNNAFYTSQTATGAISSAKSYAIGIVANNINFLAEGNAYWSVGAADGGFRTGSLTDTGNTDLANLAAWQAAISDDALAQEVDPQFANPANDLHLTNPAANTLLNAGYNNQTPSVDFDNDPRPTTAPPQTNLPHADIGADEVVQADAGVIPNGTFYNAVFADGSTATGNVTVTGTAYLTGESSIGGTLTLGCNATVVGAGGGNYVVGNVQKEFCSTGAFTFPVGTASNGSVLGTPPEYTPMTATITAGTFPSSLTVNVVDDFLIGIVQTSGVSRYWTVTETGNLTADMTFTYLDPTDVNGNEANYKVFRRSGGVTAEVTPNSNNPAANTVTVQNVSNFSDWGIGALVPTAAEVSISGRVTTSNGAGIKNAAIVITGNSLPTPKIAKTGSFGYYTVEGLDAGETYVVTVVSKRFMFQVPSRIISVTDSVTDIDFVANPEQ